MEYMIGDTVTFCHIAFSGIVFKGIFYDHQSMDGSAIIHLKPKQSWTNNLVIPTESLMHSRAILMEKTKQYEL